MQKGHQPGAEFNQPTLSVGNNPAGAESALVTAETARGKSRIERKRAAGSILEENRISITNAKTAVVEASHP